MNKIKGLVCTYTVRCYYTDKKDKFEDFKGYLLFKSTKNIEEFRAHTKDLKNRAIEDLKEKGIDIKDYYGYRFSFGPVSKKD